MEQINLQKIEKKQRKKQEQAKNKFKNEIKAEVERDRALKELASKDRGFILRKMN